MIAIVDYGAGNLRSVQNTLSEIGAEYTLVRTAEELKPATKIVLPGVGHFGQMMAALDELQLREPLLSHMRARVPFLGICLGMQALFTGSAEAPEHQGFGYFPGRVERFTDQVRSPHMGWNSLERRRDSKLLNGLSTDPYVYFAHSYYAPVVDATAATCTYSLPYTAVLEHENLYGVQFHPEKSGPIGLKIVKNFLEL